LNEDTPRRNRVDPFGDLHAVRERGLLTGNRGCLVDEVGDVVRHHRGRLWIICMTRYRDWRHPLDRPGRWTPVFFLDDAVALAAGHRPCGLCRRQGYDSYREAVTLALGQGDPLRASELDRRLALERHRPGRGLDRAADRHIGTADIGRLPNGTVIIDRDRQPRLVLEGWLLRFGFGGWADPIGRPRTGAAEVLTPPTSVAALTHGYVPVLHPTSSG
jgi:hypothetical protein